jgi:hypothetical protein
MESRFYYIPEIEEFHVGFIFEVYRGQWEQRRVWPSTFSINGAIEEIQVKSVRVKYLDRKDIESFGFTLIERKGLIHLFKTKIFEFEEKLPTSLPSNLLNAADTKVWWEIEHHIYSNEYYIYKCWDNSRDKIFQGDIKNKTILGQLILQLNIFNTIYI